MPFGTGPVDTAQLQGRLWTPALWQADLGAWYDALDGRFTNATGISQWSDKSGLGRHATQATGSAQPVLTQGYINGLPAVVFNGSKVLVSSAFAQPQTWTTFAVFRPSSVTGTQSVVDTDDEHTLRHAQNIRLNTTGVESIAFNTTPAAFTDANGITAAIGSTYLAGSVRGSSAVEIWVNGASNGSTATTGTPNSSTVGIGLGASPWSALSQPYSGGIGEAIRFGRDLTTRERQIVEGYLAWKWWLGLDKPLPGSHPFKNRPPLIGD